MKVYLAGPEVFLPEAQAVGQRKRALCEGYGLEGLFPLDVELDMSDRNDVSQRIFASNVQMMRVCDVVIANLTPFRGVSADSGTALEVGLCFALGKTIYGYSGHSRLLQERVLAGHEAKRHLGRVLAPDGFVVEAFGLSDNLMIEEAIRASGGRFFKPSSGPDRPLDDMDGFKRCLEAIAGTANQMSQPETVHARTL